MDWPGPNGIVRRSGAPGPDYWQQRADYTIAATLDTAAADHSRHREHPLHEQLAGHAALRLAAARPESLPRREARAPRSSRPIRAGASRGFRGGYDITGLQVNGRGTVGRVDDTMMRIDLDAPLSAARRHERRSACSTRSRCPITDPTAWGATARSTRSRSGIPRMAVYDDVRGWNTDPYLGQGEFYLEYGDIDYAVTVPAGYVVAGSGVLQNPRRGADAGADRAARSGRAIADGRADHHRARKRRRRSVAPSPGRKTWRFRAERVRDVAWAAAPDFRWDATSWNGVLTQAFYQFPKAGRGVGVGGRADAVVHSHVLASCGSAIRIRRRRPSPARSAAWSTRCS